MSLTNSQIDAQPERNPSFVTSGPVVSDGEDGVLFQLWAPHADQVWVLGDFNEWSEDSHEMQQIDGGEGGGWSLRVPEAGAGSQYKFSLRCGERRLIKNDPAARLLTNSVGNSIVVDHAGFDWGNEADFVMPSWNQLVIYEMHLGTFFRGDDKDQVGNFDSAIERLDHIAGLGINAIELMPVAEFAGDQSWGYNPAYPYTVESDYGGVDGFKRFVRACHKRGIAVLLDVVYNHFGPSDMDIWQFDGWSENGKGGIYFYNDWRANTPWGDTRPDYGRKEVRGYIHDNALMWLDDYHVDGLRFDMTFYMRAVNDGAELSDGWSMTQWINDSIAERHPAAITIAEDLRSNEWVTKETGAGGAGFGSQWDEQFVHPVRAVLTCREDETRSMRTIVDALRYRYNLDAFQRVVYTESHDEVANGKARVPTEVDDVEQEGYWSRKRSLLGACLTLTSPGIPMIFQGQEMLEIGSFEDSSELDWGRAPRHEGVIRFYRDLIHLRRGLRDGNLALTTQDTDVLHVNDDAKVVAYARGGEGGTGRMVVVLSFSRREWRDYRIPLPVGGAWKTLFHGDAQVYGEDFGDSPVAAVAAEDIECDGRANSILVTLGSYDCVILGQ